MNPARSCSSFVATLILAMAAVAGVHDDARGAGVEPGKAAAPAGAATVVVVI